MRTGAGVRIAALLLAAAALLPTARLAAQDAHALIIVGIGGDTIRSKRFHEWASGLQDALVQKHGMSKDRVVYLGERPELDPTRIKGPSRKENVAAAIQQIAASARAEDPVLVVIIGGSTSNNNAETSLNLTGPDLTGAELAQMLSALSSQRLAVVSTTESSGPLVQILSAPGRTIITATRTGAERNQTWFGQFFVAAYSGDGADADKDNRISLVEAYEYATREVARHYQEQGLLMTEHALIDDNGDSKGSPAPDPEAGDGQLARTFAVGRVASAANANTEDPVMRGLLQQRAEIERRMDALRARRATMEPAAYDMELEALLVELALKDQEIRRRGGGGGW